MGPEAYGILEPSLNFFFFNFPFVILQEIFDSDNTYFQGLERARANEGS